MSTSPNPSLSLSWLKVEESMGGTRHLLKGTADEMRAQFAGLGEFLASLSLQTSNSQTPDTVSSQDGTWAGIKYRLYTPRRLTHKAPEGRLPVGVYFHGGGWVLGDLDSEDALCRSIAGNTNTLIISVDYRLAPAYEAPAQLQDAIKMVEMAYENSTAWTGDPERLFTIGTSAGGALAFAVARQVKFGRTALPKDAIKGVAAFNPVVFHTQNVPEQYSSEHTAFRENRENTPLIDLAALTKFYELCNAKPDNADYFVGLDQACHEFLPPSYIVTCGCDPLRDDGKVLAQSMKSRGVQVLSDHYNGLPHCFWTFPNLPEAADFAKNASKGVRWIIDKM